MRGNTPNGRTDRFSVDGIDPAALLGREGRLAPGAAARAAVEGRRVLVTGAGGSIGGELARQVSELGPASLHLLDHDENALHRLQLDLAGHGLLDTDRTVLADVRDAVAVRRAFGEAGPEVVFHAAAHKHLPLLERFPTEGIRTNVVGTANVVAAAVEVGATTVVNISTDKAAAPTSVLGATKRLAELVVTEHAGRGTAVASVRFGNVLGSHGSFLHSLAFQVGRGLPVTVTHPEVTRFFMTVPEAAGLVVEAAGGAGGGAGAGAGEVYVLDMGEPVRILDIVERFLRATGRGATGRAAITYTGLRPGEKLHEELFDPAEERIATGHPRIWAVAPTRCPAGAVLEGARALAALAPDTSTVVVREELFGLLHRTAGGSPATPTSLSSLAASRSLAASPR